jgi:hypothetical protein
VRGKRISLLHYGVKEGERGGVIFYKWLFCCVGVEGDSGGASWVMKGSRGSEGEKK